MSTNTGARVSIDELEQKEKRFYQEALVFFVSVGLGKVRVQQRKVQRRKHHHLDKWCTLTLKTPVRRKAQGNWRKRKSERQRMCDSVGEHGGGDSGASLIVEPEGDNASIL